MATSTVGSVSSRVFSHVVSPNGHLYETIVSDTWKFAQDFLDKFV